MVECRADDIELVRAAALTTETFSWWVLLPFSAASLITGVIPSRGTRWGLFRRDWVVIKLIINVGSTACCCVHEHPQPRRGPCLSRQ